MLNKSSHFYTQQLQSSDKFAGKIQLLVFGKLHCNKLKAYITVSNGSTHTFFFFFFVGGGGVFAECNQFCLINKFGDIIIVA